MTVPPNRDGPELSRQYAEHVIAEIDTYGDPRIYTIAEDYLRLWRTIDCLLPASGCHTVEQAVDAFGAP